MTIEIDQPIEQKQLSFDEFLARYGGDNRYELIDGEVFDLEPTGLHEEVAAFIENLGLKPRRSTTALLLNMSIVYEIYAKM
ncbi:MAG: hypothetical protein O9295_24585 [Microcystis sp. LE18-22.4A]|jgi:Uma2 family endonuclease|uniref:hypothetical protein n=1 Tax=Microcystis sp. LE18-22.4A TaxID=3016432 RepID=UPI0022C6657E|nr:hypothetical protein [Microcystis sp. LE18-22.4A]MCZ8121139.1 hypothetical protein [Microcystis sp. LE18-22.4A]